MPEKKPALKKPVKKPVKAAPHRNAPKDGLFGFILIAALALLFFILDWMKVSVPAYAENRTFGLNLISAFRGFEELQRWFGERGSDFTGFVFAGQLMAILSGLSAAAFVLCVFRAAGIAPRYKNIFAYAGCGLFIGVSAAFIGCAIYVNAGASPGLAEIADGEATNALLSISAVPFLAILASAFAIIMTASGPFSAKVTGWMQNTFVLSFKNMFSELKKVSWPTREELTNYSIVVVSFMVIMAVIIGLLDMGASALLRVLLNKG